MPNNLISTVVFNYVNKKVGQLLLTIGVATILLFAGIQANAKPEYIVGLTEQDIRIATIEELELGFNYELDRLTKDKGYSLKIKVYPNEQQLTKLIAEHKVIGYFGTSVLYFNYKNTFNSKYLYTPIISNKVLNRYVLLVRKDKCINQLAQLKQSVIAYCSADEVGILYLQHLLKEKGLGAADSFFNKMIIKKNPSLAASSVFFKEVDATIILESDYLIAAELNPQLIKQMITIETSPEYITNILAFSNQDELDIKFDIEDSVYQIAQAIQRKNVLKSSKYGLMQRIKLEDLNSVRDLLEKSDIPKGKP